MEDIDSKTGTKFWIGALAFSILMLATTFALLATYLAEIKDNTKTAIDRADIVAQRLNTLDLEIAALHRHILEQKPVASEAPAAALKPTAAPETGDKAAAPAGLPALESPSMAPAMVAPLAPAPAKP